MIVSDGGGTRRKQNTKDEFIRSDETIIRD
jgi:hypothetical protein